MTAGGVEAGTSPDGGVIDPDPAAEAVRPPVWVRRGPILLVLLCALVFVPGLFGEFVWDDLSLIRDNEAIRELSRLPSALRQDFAQGAAGGDEGGARNVYYRPVVTVAYALQFQAFGPSSFGYHAVSLGLHLACVLLAFVWLRRRAGSAAAGALGALFGAALFAVHASRPESVSWISGSTDLWMTLLVLAGTLAWERVGSRWGAVVGTLALVVAVFAKETAVVAPLLLWLDAWSKDGADPGRRRAMRRALLPVVVVGAAFVARVALVPPRAAEIGDPSSVLARVGSTIGHYVRGVFWPWPPSVEASYLRFDAAGAPAYAGWSVALGLLATAGLAALAAAALRRRAVRPWLADAAWLVVPLLPVANAWPLELSTLAPMRNLYWPILGLAALAMRGFRALEGRPRLARSAVAGGVVLLAAHALVCLFQIGTLRNEDALWSYEHTIAPDNSFASARLAQLRLRQGRHGDALAAAEAAWVAANGDELRRAQIALLAAEIALASVSDADQAALSRLRRFYDDLARGAAARLVVGDRVIELRAGPRLRERLQTWPATFLVPRAVAHARTLDLEEARRQLEEVVGRFPASVDGWVQLALVLARESRWAEARRAVESGLAVQPDEARLLQLRRDVDTAERLAASSAAADPATRAMMRAQTLLAFAGFELARRELAPVLAAHPDRPEPVLLRILIDAGDARFDLARRTVEEARARMPAQSELWDEALRRIADEEQAWRSAHGVP